MLISTHINHVSVSPTDENGPTQGQRKTLTNVCKNVCKNVTLPCHWDITHIAKKRRKTSEIFFSRVFTNNAKSFSSSCEADVHLMLIRQKPQVFTEPMLGRLWIEIICLPRTNQGQYDVIPFTSYGSKYY